MFEDDPEARRRAEAQLNKRDRQEARLGRLQRPPAFLDSGPLPSFVLSNDQRTKLNLLCPRVADDTMTLNRHTLWTAVMP